MPLGSTLQRLALVVGAVVVIVLLVSSAFVVLAFVAPVFGLGIAGLRLKAARILWKSQGRLQVGQELHIVGARQTRRLALLEGVTGLGGLLASAVPALAIFESAGSAIVGGLVAAALISMAGSSRRRLLSETSSVQVLPPEGQDHFPR